MLSNSSWITALALCQGFYFFVTGIWAIVHIRSFQMVTGPKSDLWLVKTVGVLIAVIGLVLMAAGYHGRVTIEIFLLAAGSSASLAAVDVVYVRSGTISRIYLLDAAVEAVLVLSWMFLWFES